MASRHSSHRTLGIDFCVNRLGDAVVKLTDNASMQSQPLGKIETITVYLAYAEDVQRQHYLTLQVIGGTTLYEALTQAGWLVQFPELATWCEQVVDIQIPAAKRWHVGIYAQKQPLSYVLQPLDRIEVYRSLSADPMSQRKSRGVQKKQK